MSHAAAGERHHAGAAVVADALMNMKVPSCRALAAGIWIGALAVLSAGPASQVAAPAPIQFDVAVRDADGSPLAGLAAQDFSVIEGGVRRAVLDVQERDVRQIDRGLAPWIADIPKDVATNDLGSRRVVILLVANAAPRARPDLTLSVKAIANRIVGDLGPEDLAAVAFTASGQTENFTTDRARLKTAIDTIAIGAEANADAARAVGRALAMCDALSGRRKTLIYIGPKSTPLVPSAVDALAAGAARANVVLDVIDPETGANAPRAKSGRANASRLPAGQDIVELSARTGGRAVMSGNDPGRDAAAMIRDAGAYYMLTFAPDEHARPGEWRPASIAVARPGATVQARPGYTIPAVAGRTTVLTLDRAVGTALPSNGVRLQVAAAPFASTARSRAEAVLAVRVMSAPDDFDDTDAIQLLAVAYGSNGRAVATAKASAAFAPAVVRTDADRRPVTPGAARSCDVLLRLPLAPGVYDVHVAVQHGASVGTVVTSLVVPDLARARVSMSGVVMRRAPVDSTVAPPMLADLVPIVPGVDRTFRTADDVIVFARIYQGERAPVVSVAARVSVRDRANRVVFDQAVAMAADRFLATHAADLRMPLPLTQLDPGEYLLTVQALGGPDAARTYVRFVVE